MTHTDIDDIVRKHVLEQYLPDEDPTRLTPDTPLISGGLLDSLNVLELVAFLEERFSVRFEAHEVDRDRLDTLDSIGQMVREKLGGKA